MRKTAICIAMIILSRLAAAGCPTMDFTGDCQVNLSDLAAFAAQWLSVGTPQPDITWVTINDTGAGMKDFNGNPILDRGGFVGQMSKYETTNAQYCEFLNAQFDNDLIFVYNNKVYARTDITLTQPYYYLTGPGYTDDGAVNGGASRIHLSQKRFVVDSGFENHPVTYVTGYGALVFCSYYGWRLPTEWEWQAVADYDGSFLYSCGLDGQTFSSTYANYYTCPHPCGTVPVATFGASGYRLCNMAGNVSEWTSSPLNPEFMHNEDYVVRGGSWSVSGVFCHVADRSWSFPLAAPRWDLGFRACR